MIHRSTFILSFLTLISRVLGLIRAILTANFLGTTFIADAFMIAFKIPNLLRRLVGEGSMTAAFIPVFSDIKKSAKGDIKIESKFLSAFYSVSLIILIFISVLGMIFSPYIVKLLYLGGDKDPEAAIFLTRFMFSYITFISLAAITQGVLNANMHFAVPALSPIILNILIISSLFTFLHWIPNNIIFYFLPNTKTLLLNNEALLFAMKAAFSLSLGVIIGGSLQFFIQLPTFFKLGYRLFFTFNFKDKNLLKIGKLMIPGIFGLGIYNINALIADPFVLTYLEEGCVAALNYSNRLLEFSIGIFVISISTVILPNLSKHISDGKIDQYSNMVIQSVKVIIFISMPATFGLIVLREPLINLLFKSGLFTSRSGELVSSAVFYHSIGLVFISLHRIYSPAFYALKDTKTPVIGSFISLVVNLLGCAVLPLFMGIGGIALASSLAAFANMIYLIVKLEIRVPFIQFKKLNTIIYKSLVSALFMSFFLYLIQKMFIVQYDNKLIVFLFIIISIIIGNIAYFGVAFLLKTEEALHLFKIILKKLFPSKFGN